MYFITFIIISIIIISIIIIIYYYWTAMVTCEEWMNKDYLEKFWNGVRLKEGRREDLEMRGYRK